MTGQFLIEREDIGLHLFAFPDWISNGHWAIRRREVKDCDAMISEMLTRFDRPSFQTRDSNAAVEKLFALGTLGSNAWVVTNFVRYDETYGYERILLCNDDPNGCSALSQQYAGMLRLREDCPLFSEPGTGQSVYWSHRKFDDAAWGLMPVATGRLSQTIRATFLPLLRAGE